MVDSNDPRRTTAVAVGSVTAVTGFVILHGSDDRRGIRSLPDIAEERHSR